MAEINVVGAGLAGIAAAITLARRGYEVTVLEKEKKIGGPEALVPGIHFTGTESQGRFNDLVGIDLSNDFRPALRASAYVGEREVRTNPDVILLVERGPRPSSIDNSLLKTAEKAGVKFEFGQEVRSLDSLPPGSIIACGHDPVLYQDLKQKTGYFHGFSYTEEIQDKKDSFGFTFIDDYATEAFYGGIVNGLLYCLIYSMKPVNPEHLPRCERQIKERAGISIKSWQECRVAYPFNLVLRPKLFLKDYILAGMVSGANTPSSGLGINAAFITGCIAAKAVWDKEGAQNEFDFFIRHHLPWALLRIIVTSTPSKLRLALMKKLALSEKMLFGMVKMTMGNVPGYNL